MLLVVCLGVGTSDRTYVEFKVGTVQWFSKVAPFESGVFLFAVLLSALAKLRSRDLSKFDFVV